MVHTPVAWAIYYSVLLPKEKLHGFRSCAPGMTGSPVISPASQRRLLHAGLDQRASRAVPAPVLRLITEGLRVSHSLPVFSGHRAAT